MAAYERKEFKQSYDEFRHAAELGDIPYLFQVLFEAATGYVRLLTFCQS